MLNDKTVKVGALVTGVAVLGYGLYANGLRNAARRIVVENNYAVDVNERGIALITRPLIKNPSGLAIEIEQPFASIYLDRSGSPIGSSSPVNKRYLIPNSGQIALDPVRIEMQWLQVPKLFTAARTGKITLYTKVSVPVFLSKLAGLRFTIDKESKEELNTTAIKPYLDSLAGFIKF